MTPDKQTPKPDAAKPEPINAGATSEYLVAGPSSIYVGEKRYDPLAAVQLTASQAERLGDLIAPHK